MTSKTAEKYGKRIDFKGEVKFVRLGQMKVSPVAQRDLRIHRVNYLFSQFDPDKMGLPRLSQRAGIFWIVDGQHRIEACKKFLGEGWEDVSIECLIVEGLTETEEAEYFLSLADVLAVNSFQKFKIALTAGRRPEIEIAAILQRQNLAISRQDKPGSLSCTATMIRIYKRDGAEAFEKAIFITKNAFGDSGLEGPLLDGLGLWLRRFSKIIDTNVAINAFKNINAGVNGFINLAKTKRLKTGRNYNECLAETAVITYNHEASPKEKLPNWFKENQT